MRCFPKSPMFSSKKVLSENFGSFIQEICGLNLLQYCICWGLLFQGLCFAAPGFFGDIGPQIMKLLHTPARLEMAPELWALMFRAKGADSVCVSCCTLAIIVAMMVPLLTLIASSMGDLEGRSQS